MKDLNEAGDTSPFQGRNSSSVLCYAISLFPSDWRLFKIELMLIAFALTMTKKVIGVFGFSRHAQ